MTVHKRPETLATPVFAAARVAGVGPALAETVGPVLESQGWSHLPAMPVEVVGAHEPAERLEDPDVIRAIGGRERGVVDTRIQESDGGIAQANLVPDRPLAQDEIVFRVR